MLKHASGALLSLMLLAVPLAAQAQDAAPKKHVVKKARHHLVLPAGVQTKTEAKGKLVKHVVMSHGRRKVVYERVIITAPSVPTMGDLAGLNLTRDPLDLKSSVALVLDQSNSEVLFEKNSNVALPIASITKMMTGLIVVQAHQDMDEMLTVTDDDVDRVKFSSSRLKVGAQLSRANMLHIALMSSENRAASALGRNYPGGREAFVAAMNAKASELGMNDTHYVDTNGLSKMNVASAHDLARLMMAAYQEPLLRQYSTDPKAVVEANGRPMQFGNTNYLVAMPGWDIGLQKTGFINEAGRCLMMQAVVAGRAVILDRHVTQSGRDLVGRRHQVFQPVILQAVGRRRDRQSGDQLAAVVADAGGHAAHPQLQFFVVARITARAHQAQFALQLDQIRDGILVVPGQAGARRVGADRLRLVDRQEQLAGRGQVQRAAAADGAHHLHAGALGKRPVDVDDLVALAYRQVDGLLGLFVQRAHEVQRRLAHRQPALDHIAQFQQPHAEPVRARLDAVDKARQHHVVEDAMGGRRMQAGHLGQFLQADRIGIAGQRIEQRDHALDHLDGGFLLRGGIDFHDVVGAVQYSVLTLYHNVKKIGIMWRRALQL